MPAEIPLDSVEELLLTAAAMLANLSRQSQENVMKRSIIIAVRMEAMAGSPSGSFFGFFYFFP
jgi:hypothetical protein